MTDRTKQFAIFLIRILITTGLLLWVLSKIDLEQFHETVKAAKWWFLFAVWVLIVIIFWINSIKMQLILKKQDCNVSIATLFGASAITLFYSMIIPGILSTGVKWYILKKDTGKSSSVFSSMFYNQMSIMVVMMVFGLAALMITNPASQLKTDANNRWLLPVVSGILMAATILISLLLLNVRTGGKIIKAFSLLFKPFPAKIHRNAQNILEQLAIFQTAGAGFHVTMLFFTIIVNIIGGVLIYLLSAKAANITAPFGVFVWLCVVIYILGRVPISIANLGVREVTLVGFLGIYGVAKSQALLMSMILFSTVILMAAIGAIYQFFWAVSKKKSKS